MTITINKTEDSYTGSKLVFFTTSYNDVDYKSHGNMPSDANAQEYWDLKEDELKWDILRIQYREAVVPQLEDKSDLESFEAWVSAGCKNAEVKGEDMEGNEYVITPEKVIEKTAWVDSH
jgi:hypothetical protein